MNQIPISVIILTYNEEQNLSACLKSVTGWVDEIFVVDSGSTDQTKKIAKKYEAKIFSHSFNTHAQQWNWALKNLPLRYDWIFGLDADQWVSDNLKNELMKIFKKHTNNIDGFYVRRKQIFMKKWIKFGGYYPKYLLKIFRKDKVTLDESDLVDHHFYVNSTTKNIGGDIIEDNAKERNISFWLTKHIRYAELHALESIRKEQKKIQPSMTGSPDQKILFQKKLYDKLPLFIRPLLYFIYRYIFKLGFLDGKEGLIFHFLQGFWYRFLVDAHIFKKRKAEIKKLRK